MRSLRSSPLDRWLAPPPDPQRVDWLRRWTYAHRGLHRAGVAENSRAAYADAVAAGLGIECDIQRSRDGQPMLFHDWDLARLTGRDGAVADYDAADLAQIQLNGAAAGETIPVLNDLLEIVAGQVPFLIEIKSRRGYDIAPSCRAVRDAMALYTGPYTVMSFDPRVARWFRRNSPETLRGLVMEEVPEGLTPTEARRHLALWIAQPDFLAYDVKALPSAFAAAQRARGIPVTSWTVKTPELAERARIHADAPIAEGGGLADIPA